MEGRANIKLSTIFIIAFLLFSCSCDSEKEDNIFPDKQWSSNYSITENRLVWQEKHAAFTSLIKYNEEYFLAFRVGEKHRADNKSENGFIRVIRSKDLKRWNPLDSISYDGDLRDPYLSITPRGELHLTCGINEIIDGKIKHTKTVIAFFNPLSKKFSTPVPLKMDDNSRTWLWKYIWHKDKAYGFAYLEGLTPLLMQSTDGINWNKLDELPISVEFIPSEVDLVIDRFDKMTAIIRNDKGKSLIATSKSPYHSQWSITEMDEWIGCPDIIINSHNQIFITYRYYDKQSVKYAFRMVNADLTFEKKLILKESKSYDIGYGSSIFIDTGQSIIVSYYSADETSKGIYIAKITCDN